MLDAVVVDIPSRKMLFRAPGTSHISGKSTPVNLSEQLRKDSANGFRAAAASMVDNLDDQLALFREKIKEQPDEYKVVHKPGYTGGGSLDILTLAAISAFGLASALLRRRRREAA